MRCALPPVLDVLLLDQLIHNTTGNCQTDNRNTFPDCQSMSSNGYFIGIPTNTDATSIFGFLSILVIFYI